MQEFFPKFSNYNLSLAYFTWNVVFFFKFIQWFSQRFCYINSKYFIILKYSSVLRHAHRNFSSSRSSFRCFSEISSFLVRDIFAFFIYFYLSILRFFVVDRSIPRHFHYCYYSFQEKKKTAGIVGEHPKGIPDKGTQVDCFADVP